MSLHIEVSVHSSELTRSETMDFGGEKRTKYFNNLNKIDKTALISALSSLRFLFQFLRKMRYSGAPPKRSDRLLLINFTSSIGGIVINISLR